MIIKELIEQLKKYDDSLQIIVCSLDEFYSYKEAFFVIPGTYQAKTSDWYHDDDDLINSVLITAD